ncbi:glycosyltransferase [Cognataquiflexum nitidum]|uniref:glycosyltransferase n=1 Tax=Cognataquiflexum nitidum TaxID=2922272 RepID=UPI001F12A49B|nr:glycosyltransferase [Cognataquiflexum nitidum]
MITYNHGDFLKEAINAALNQKIEDEFELLVSDDCSTDNTPELVNSLIKTHPLGHRIRYIRHNTNLGMSENFFWTLNQCEGEFIAYCEGDDYWTDPKKLQKQIDYLNSNEQYSFAFHRTTLFYQDSQISKPDLNERFFKENQNQVEITGFTLANGWQIGMQTLVFRRNLISDLDIRPFKYFRDVHLLAHLLNSSKGICLNFFGSVYRIHENGVHSKTQKNESLKIGYGCFDELYRHYKKDFLKLSICNYLHELIQNHIIERNFQQAIHYLKKLMKVDFSLKVMAYYFKEMVLPKGIK